MKSVLDKVKEFLPKLAEANTLLNDQQLDKPQESIVEIVDLTQLDSDDDSDASCSSSGSSSSSGDSKSNVSGNEDDDVIVLSVNEVIFNLKSNGY